MSNIKVRITIGHINVEIEAPPEKLEEAVKQVVSAIRTSSPQETLPQVVAERRTTRAVTCRGIVEEMVGEGWFNTPRSLSEVASEIARRGYNYDRTAVAHVLLELVRVGMLTREGEARNYLYRTPSKHVEKKPQEETETMDEASAASQRDS